MEEDEDVSNDRWQLDDTAQARHVATIKEHPDSPEAERAREELLRAHKPLIRRVASRYVWRAGQYHDLIAGYLQAVSRCDPRRGPVWPYAKRDVLGAIQDEAYHLNAGAVAVPEAAGADLLRLRRLDPGNKMEDTEVAAKLGLTVDRVVELRGLARRSARLESSIGGGSYNGGDKPKTLGENVPEEQRFVGHSKMFESRDAAMGKGVELGRWVTALYSAFGEDEIGERNRRIVLSHYRATLIALELDAARDRLQLAGGPILKNRRVWTETFYRFPTDADAERIGGAGAALVVRVVYDGVPGEDQAHADRETLRRDGGDVQRVDIADSRVCAAYDWPFPQQIDKIAEALGVTERAIYKVIGKFNRELAAIRAEEE